MTEDLLFEAADGIGHLTFNRPAQRNALTWAMYDGLVEVIERIDADGSMRALIITGAGEKAFAAGTDIGQFRAFNSPADAIGYEERIDRVLTILEILSRADHRRDRRSLHGRRGRHRRLLRLADRRRGRAVRLPNRQDARQLSLDGQPGPAVRADRRRPGQGGHLHGTADRGARRRSGSGSSPRSSPPLRSPSRAAELARTVAGLAPLTLRSTKMALRRLQGSVAEDEELILMCYQSADFREGMEAFLEKRPPVWQGA